MKDMTMNPNMLRKRAVAITDAGCVYEYPTGERYVSPYAKTEDEVEDETAPQRPRRHKKPRMAKGAASHWVLRTIADQCDITLPDFVRLSEKSSGTIKSSIAFLTRHGFVTSSYRQIKTRQTYTVRAYRLTEKGRQQLITLEAE